MKWDIRRLGYSKFDGYEYLLRSEAIKIADKMVEQALEDYKEQETNKQSSSEENP